MTNEIKNVSTQPNVPQEEMKGKEENNSKKQKNELNYRLIPIWLRIVIVLILLLLATIVGLIIGYSGIGDGKLLDSLKWGTYQHILDIISGKE